jgi:hypothetical protein
MEKAKAILSRNKAAYLTIEEMKDFIKSGEKMLVFDNSDELAKLKNEQKRAKQWMNNFDAMNSMEESSAERGPLINSLIEEANALVVNVSEYIDSVVQATKTYCVCRQLYFGFMVGCDNCDEWYHFQCVGLSQAQAEKSDKYICIRCSLKNSMRQSAIYAAQITNKWMDCQEHFKQREHNIAKVREHP